MIFLSKFRENTTHKVHKHLLSKLLWYKKWHGLKYHHHIHFAALAGYAFAIGIFIAASMYLYTGRVLAASGSWSQTSFAGSGDGTYVDTQSSGAGGELSLYSNANFGTGSDGALSAAAFDINTQTNGNGGRTQPDAVNFSVTGLTSTTATLSTTPVAGALKAGDEVLLINLQGITSAYANVGNYETLRVAADVTTTTVSFTTGKTKYYGNGASDDTNIGIGTTNQKVMLQRVPNYSDISIAKTANSFADTFPGTTLNSSNWVEIDPNSSINVNDGLVLSSVSTAWDKAIIAQSTFSRSFGRTLYGRFTVGSDVAKYGMFGWGTNQTTDPSYARLAHGLYFSAGGLNIYQNGALAASVGSGYSANTAYEIKITLGAVGAKYYIKGGIYTSWTLLHADTTVSTTDLRPMIAQYNSMGTYNEIAVYDDGVLTASPWNGTKGGVLFVRSSQTATIGGSLDMQGAGYRGGVGALDTARGGTYGQIGEGYVTGQAYQNAGAYGGGGGGKNPTCADGRNGGGGGAGGSYATSSSSGTAGTAFCSSQPGGTTGSLYGTSDVTKIYFGAGGGGGGGNNDWGGIGVRAGRGGNGGGIVFVQANTLNITGSAENNGLGGGRGPYSNAGGGGGGAGGSVQLGAFSLNIGTALVKSKGAPGGVGAPDGIGHTGGAGSAGTNGRIKLEATTLVGTSDPAAGYSGSISYATSGTFTTNLLPTTVEHQGKVYGWGNLTLSSVLNNQGLSVDVLDGVTGSTFGFGTTTITTSPQVIDLSSISTVDHPSLKIRANFTSDGSDTAYINDFSLGYSYDVTAPTTPAALTVGTVTSSSVPLSWTASTDGESGVAGYEVVRAPDVSGSPGAWSSAGGTCATLVEGVSCVDSGLSSNTKYYYRLRAKDNAGNYSAYGGVRDGGSGGTVTNDEAYVYHTFTSNGTFTVPSGNNLTATVLIVAGGGSGGGGKYGIAYGGGGGGGGMLEGNITISPGDYTATIGNGGTAVAVETRGNSGQNSSFGTIVANGGGGGGAVTTILPNKNGISGGSGGGGGGQYSGAAGLATQGNVDGLVGYGYNGAAGQTNYAGGGGGGAGHAGYQSAPWGGAGRVSSVNSSTYGAGGILSDALVPGGVNTGNGGAGTANYGGSAGGSGIIIIRYSTQYTSTTTLPGVPTGLSATAVSTSQINLSWSVPSGGATRYHVKYSGDGYASNIYDDTATSYNDMGRPANAGYTYRVYSVNASGEESSEYAEATKYTLAVNASASSDKAISTWYNTAGIIFTNEAGFGSGGVSKYKYVWDQNATHTWTGSESDEWSSSTLSLNMQNGNSYLHIKAYNGDDVSASSGSEQSYGPYMLDNEGPTGSIVIGVDDYTSNNFADLYLSAGDARSGVAEMAFTNGAVYCSYEVYSEVRLDWDMIDPLCGGQDTDGVKTVKVKFRDVAGNESIEYSDDIILDRAAPTNPASTVGRSSSGQVDPNLTSSNWANYPNPRFDWSGAVDPISGVLGYWVYFGTDSGAEPKTSVDSSNLFYVDNGGDNFNDSAVYEVSSSLVSGSTYYLKVRSMDNAFNDAPASYVEGSNEFIYRYDNVSPTNPSNISVSPSGWASSDPFTFSWPAGSDADSNVLGYEYKRNNGTDDWTLTTGRSVNNIEHYQSGVNIFQLRTVDNAGNRSSELTWPYLFSGTVSAPENLQVDLSHSQGQTVNNFKFTWDAPSGVTPQGYYYSINAAPNSENSILTTDDFTDYGAFAEHNGTNTFYVVAKDENGNVGWNNPAQANFVVNTADPSVPQNVTITDASNRNTSLWALTVAWTSLSDPTPDFSGYEVWRCTANCTDDANFNDKRGEVTTNIFSEASLSNSTDYYYKVKSRDSVGNTSDFSSSVHKIPTGKYTVPSSYTSLPEASAKSTSATIKWTTDRPTNTIAQYGLTASYGSEGSKSTESVTSHTIELSGLMPGTTYHFRAQSLDLDRDYDPTLAYSDDYTFKTLEQPGISQVNVSDVGLYSAIVTWKTTSSSTSSVKYGTTTNYGEQVNDSSSSSVTTHTVKIDKLSDSTMYHFKVFGTDVDGNSMQSDDYTFQTLIFPRISNLQLGNVPDAVSNTVKLNWDSNVPLSSTVQYKEAGGGSLKEISVSKLDTKHELLVSGLKDNMDYVFIVQGRDAYGNLASSAENKYLTAYDTRAPGTDAVNVESSVIGTGLDARIQVVVSWQTDEPSTSQVEYAVGISGDMYNLKTQEDSTMTMTHVVVISDLKPATTYHFRVLSKDQAGNSGFSEDSYFLTQQASQSILGLILDAIQKAFGWLFNF